MKIIDLNFSNYKIRDARTFCNLKRNSFINKLLFHFKTLF